MMNSSMPSSSNGTPMRTCSDMRCKAPLSVGCKGNLCPNCVARMRSHRGFSSEKVQTMQQSDVPSPYPPTSVTTHMGANIVMSNLNPNSVIIPHQTMTMTPPHTGNVGSVPHGHYPNPSMQRSSVVPRHRPSVMYVPNTSATQGVPAIQHFNSRGELINHRRIHPTVIDLRNPQPQMQEQPHSRFPQGGRGCRQCGVSFVSTKSQELCPSCQHRSAATTQKDLKANVSKDEDIKVAETKPLVQVASVPKRPSPINHNSDPQDKSTVDIMMDDLELVYPETEGGNTSGGVSDADADVQMREILKLDDIAGDQNIISANKITSSPHNPPDSRHKSPNTSSVHDQSRVRRNFHTVPNVLDNPPKGRNQSLKLCSSENCTGIISANSLATRCLQCVKNDWLFLKDIRNVERDALVQASMLQTPSEVCSNPESTVVKRKGVTWADQVDNDNDTERQSVFVKSPVIVKTPKMRETSQASPLLVSSPSPLMGKDLAIESPLKESLQTLSAVSSIQASQEDPACSPKETPAKSPDKLPRVRLLLGKPKERPLSSDSGVASTSRSSPTMSPLWPQASQSTMGAFPGWESDLTELSDSTDDASTSDAASSSESESPNPSLVLPQVKIYQSSPSSGLKIRIPARPGGVFVPRCASSRCNNTLAFGYKWKSCVLCRARNREYQRRRHNVQAGHMRLDQELEVAGITFPVADINNRSSSSESMSLVPGARLCSVRDCSFIVPPEDEYQWKMCALDRLRRREQKKPHTDLSKNKRSKHADMLLKLTSPTFTCARSRKGRCQSRDCGMMLTDPNAAQCVQCTTRRLRLIKRSGQYPSALQPMRHVNQPMNPSPYPQFKSFSTFLLEFKQRLTGFLHAQSVFFLFKDSKRINSVFALDGEYSTCCMDFDLLRRRAQIEEESLKLKRSIEHVGRLKFSPTPQVSELDGGGIAMRFNCIYPVPILQGQGSSGDQVPAQSEPPSLETVTKHMKCELEIANLPDHSHRFIPGQRTIIRFRLLG